MLQGALFCILGSWGLLGSIHLLHSDFKMMSSSFPFGKNCCCEIMKNEGRNTADKKHKAGQHCLHVLDLSCFPSYGKGLHAQN